MRPLRFSLLPVLTLATAGFFAPSFLAAQNFRVQLAALDTPAPADFFKGRPVDNLVTTVNAQDIHHYYAGGAYRTREEAEKVQQQMVEKGFKTAQIIDLEVQRLLSEAGCPYRGENPFRFFIQEDSIQRSLFFGFGSALLTPEARAKLDLVARDLRRNKRLIANLYGFTDAVGKGQANIDLAAARARAARDYLIDFGKVEADRMFLKIFGEAIPLIVNKDFDENDLPENRRLNRRVVVRVIGY